MKRNVIVISVVVFVLALLSLAGWANHQNRVHRAIQLQVQKDQPVVIADSAGVPHMVSPMVGKAAPNFTLTNLAGKKVSLADYKGKAIQLNFWATWCAPCKVETPWLVDLEKQYSPQGFEVLGVSFDDLDKDNPKLLAREKVDIAKTAQQLGIRYPVLIDGDSIAKPYGDPDVFPTSFFVNRQGEITAVTFGLTSKDDLENNIRKALGGDSQTTAGGKS